jgi:hypothetical protein
VMGATYGYTVPKQFNTLSKCGLAIRQVSPVERVVARSKKEIDQEGTVIAYSKDI